MRESSRKNGQQMAKREWEIGYENEDWKTGTTASEKKESNLIGSSFTDFIFFFAEYTVRL